MEKGLTKKDCTFGPTLNPHFPLKKSKKISCSAEKLQPLGYPDMSKSRLSLLSPF